MFLFFFCFLFFLNIPVFRCHDLVDRVTEREKIVLSVVHDRCRSRWFHHSGAVYVQTLGLRGVYSETTECGRSRILVHPGPCDVAVPIILTLFYNTTFVFNIDPSPLRVHRSLTFDTVRTCTVFFFSFPLVFFFSHNECTVYYHVIAQFVVFLYYVTLLLRTHAFARIRRTRVYVCVHTCVRACVPELS